MLLFCPHVYSTTKQIYNVILLVDTIHIKVAINNQVIKYLKLHISATIGDRIVMSFTYEEGQHNSCTSENVYIKHAMYLFFISSCYK